MTQKILFSTLKYQYLKEQLLQWGDLKNGDLEISFFPDGERYMRILTDIHHQEVFLLGGTVSDQDTLEIYDLACAFAKQGADKLTLIIPYFGYSTMERAVKKGEVVTAKTRARLFSSIPTTNKGNHLILMDLHSEGLPHYFEGSIHAMHLYCKPLIMQICKEIAGTDFVLACTDAGRAKWVESLANDMGVNAAFVFKRRLSGDNTLVTGINADVVGKTVILYDDMIRTGGSLIQAGEAYRQAGASKLYAITTHGLFSNNAVEKIKNSQVFEKIFATNTHINVMDIRDEFLVVKSVAPLLHEKIATSI
ncbi:MAG TPA: ribose-phosphate pyrophosphokinase [Microscillaceae bacterium]|nr:ribose-phosphate pyrophosphokinase [Microscillaceae bacterium]